MEPQSVRVRTANIIKDIADELTPDEIHQARLIVARQKFWTKDIEKLLRRWRRQINDLQGEHKLAEKKYNKRYYIIGVPATVLAAIVASGILSTFKNCNECSAGCIPAASGSCANDEWIRLVMGIIGLISILFTCVSVFMNYGQASSDNKNSASDFGSLAREIDAVLDSPVSARGDPISFLHGIRARFDDMLKNSPIVSSKISLEYRTIEERKKSVAPGPPRPDQVHLGAKKGKIPDASSLARILIDNIEAEEQERVSIRKKVEKENDHDTDEEKEVAITFDLDELKPEDLLENNRRNIVQSSLARALEFELNRMYTDVEEPVKDKLESTSPKIDVRKKKKKIRRPSSTQKDIESCAIELTPKDKEEI